MIERIVQKRAKEVGGQLIYAQRHLQAAGEVCEGEAFLALCGEVAFRRGVAFTLRKLASLLDDKDILRRLDVPLYSRPRHKPSLHRKLSL